MTGRTLLLVEDQFIVATVEKDALERCGYAVLVAHSEATAISLCRAHPEIDLILMDVNLGTDRDGIDAAASILNEHDLPIVFLSIHSQPEMVERTEHVISYGYVLKNAGITVLNASIKMALQLFAERQRVREQQRQIHQSAATLVAVLESNTDLIWAIDRSHALLYANSHFVRAAEDWYGMTVNTGENLLQQIPQAWRDEWQHRYDHVFAGEYLVEIITVKRDSGVGYLEIHGHPITVQEQVIGAAFSAKDITARKRTELALHAERNRLAGIVSSADVGTWEWNVRTGDLKVNASWTRMLGYTHQEWQSATIDVAFALIHPEDWERGSAAIERHLGGDTEAYECLLRMQHKNGHWKWILTKGRVVSRDRQGHPTWFFGTHADVDDLKAAEQALRRTIQTERVLLRELRHRAKNSFSLISAMITLMSAVPESPETAAALGKIHARVLAIAGMYDQLDAHESTTTLRLDEYLCRIVPALIGASSSIALECTCDPITVSVDIASPLGLIMAELVTNALKHAFPEPRTGTIQVTIRQIEDALHLELADDGIGVPAGFDPAKTDSFGLRIVEKLIAQIQGRMEVCGKEGTRYSICIPLQGTVGEGPAGEGAVKADTVGTRTGSIPRPGHRGIVSGHR